MFLTTMLVIGSLLGFLTVATLFAYGLSNQKGLGGLMGGLISGSLIFALTVLLPVSSVMSKAEDFASAKSMYQSSKVLANSEGSHYFFDGGGNMGLIVDTGSGVSYIALKKDFYDIVSKADTQGVTWEASFDCGDNSKDQAILRMFGAKPEVAELASCREHITVYMSEEEHNKGVKVHNALQSPYDFQLSQEALDLRDSYENSVGLPELKKRG